MPAGANLPSIFRNPRVRWKLEWQRLKARFHDLKGLDKNLILSFISVKHSPELPTF